MKSALFLLLADVLAFNRPLQNKAILASRAAFLRTGRGPWEIV